MQGDIGNGELVAHLLREHDINAVMHLAAESHVDRSIDSPEQFIMTNFVGTFRLLDAALRHHQERSAAGKEDFRFLHVCTDEVFGSLGPDDPAFSETTPYAPNSPYSASKAGSDHLARAYVHTFQLPVVTTNCSNNYGPFQFPEKLMPLMIQKVIRGEKLPVYGDGSNVRDWLYVEDHCRGLTLALLKGEVGETYNIGGKCEMKNIDVVHAIIAAVNAERPDLKRTPEELITYRQGPPRPRPALRDRLQQDRPRTRLAAAGDLRHRPAQDRPLVSRPREVGCGHREEVSAAAARSRLKAIAIHGAFDSDGRKCPKARLVCARHSIGSDGTAWGGSNECVPALRDRSSLGGCHARVVRAEPGGSAKKVIRARVSSRRRTHPACIQFG